MRWVVAAAVLGGCLVSGACDGDPRMDGAYSSVPSEGTSPSVTAVVSDPSTLAAALPMCPRWTYMLQNDVSAEIVGTDFNVVVMDYTKDGTDVIAQRYTPAEMTVIKEDGAARVALAYLSIGEAEEYRYYFDPQWTDEARSDRADPDAPVWLGRGNPEWEGNYKVQYWSEEWQHVVLEYVDKIVAYGFDGAYLDIVDAFEYWSDQENGEGYCLSEREAATRMIAFVRRIAAHVREQVPGFLIIPQNAERILAYDTGGEYLATIDGIGVEDLFYDERTVVDPAVTAERVTYLDEVVAAGKQVIVVDYVYAGSRDAAVEDFLAKAFAAGYFPYAASIDRELDRLVKFAGQGE